MCFPLICFVVLLVIHWVISSSDQLYSIQFLSLMLNCFIHFYRYLGLILVWFTTQVLWLAQVQNNNAQSSVVRLFVETKILFLSPFCETKKRCFKKVGKVLFATKPKEDTSRRLLSDIAQKMKLVGYFSDPI